MTRDRPSEGSLRFNNSFCINYKGVYSQNVASGRKYPLQDLNSTTYTPRLVRK